MKALYGGLIFLVLIAIPIAVGANVVDGYELRAENEYLALYLNPTTASVAVRVKSSGSIWYSNPADWREDPLVGGINRDFIQSQLRITYFDISAREFNMNSYFDAVRREQIEIKDLPDGFRITYTLGDLGEAFVIPQVISAERLYALRENMGERDWATVSRRYMAEGDNYILRPGIQDFALAQLHTMLYEAGYTEDDLVYDHTTHGIEVIEEFIYFVIPLVYRLDGQSLIAYIPAEDIVAPDHLPLARINMLEFFGAAGVDAEGYIFVPDGSGALIHLNNGRTAAQQFIARVYGRDRTFSVGSLPPQPEPVRMPVFGIRQDDKAMFAIIEDGCAFATIFARVSGTINSYNYVNVEFMTRPFDFLQLEHMGDNQLQMFQPQIFEGDFRIRYVFLEGEEANYSGMARFYQNYLVAQGLLNAREHRNELPFVMEALGAIVRTQNFMGIPYQGTVPLTTFDQAISIMDRLRENDVNNIVLKYSGWLNGGMHQQATTRFNVVRQLGGRSDFESLIEYVNEHDIQFFPEAHFNYVHRTTGFFRRIGGGISRFFGAIGNFIGRIGRSSGDRPATINAFTPSGHAARNLQNSVSRRADFHLVLNWNTQIIDTMGFVAEPTPFIVSPRYYDGLVSSFVDSFERFNTSGVAVGTLLAEPNSAFNNNGVFDRQRAVEQAALAGQQLAEAGHRQLANGANAYGFAGLDFIVNVPFEDSGFMVANDSVPFYQMVIRGFIEYTGTPINMAADLHYHMLKTLETGSGLYVQWMYEENSIVRESHFTRFFSHNYSRSFDRAVAMYHEVAAVLNHVQGERIINHDIFDNGLRRTTFENGVAIWLNFTNDTLTHNNITVEPLNFTVEGV